MEQIFIVGRRYKVLTALAVSVNTVITGIFYFIYRYLLGSFYTEWQGTALAICFLAIAAGVIKLTLWVSKRYAASVCYRVGEKELVIGSGQSARHYLWTAFTAVELSANGAYRLDTVLPISFYVCGETLTLNQYVGDIYRLADEILIHIEPYVPVDPALKKQVEAMRGAL